MSGTYRLRDQPEQPLSFSIHVVANSVLGFLKDGKASLTGTIDAPGLAEDAAISGVMTVLPVRNRMIRYEFRFQGDDGDEYRFLGEKTIAPTRPALGFRDLPATISDENGTHVAQCRLQFDLRGDLWSFLRSWRPYA